jgi:hypothetical protein
MTPIHNHAFHDHSIHDHSFLRFSLVFVWLVTAVVSVWELHGQSSALLVSAGISGALETRMLVWGGAAIDAMLGLALWFWPGRKTYLSALGFMLLMTVIATWVQPTLWLHPLGPLTKNIPIAAVLWVLAKSRL